MINNKLELKDIELMDLEVIEQSREMLKPRRLTSDSEIYTPVELDEETWEAIIFSMSEGAISSHNDLVRMYGLTTFQAISIFNNKSKILANILEAKTNSIKLNLVTTHYDKLSGLSNDGFHDSDKIAAVDKIIKLVNSDVVEKEKSKGNEVNINFNLENILDRINKK